MAVMGGQLTPVLPFAGSRAAGLCRWWMRHHVRLGRGRWAEQEIVVPPSAGASGRLLLSGWLRNRIDPWLCHAVCPPRLAILPPPRSPPPHCASNQIPLEPDGQR